MLSRQTDEALAGVDDGPTIVHGSWEDDATHVEDTSDYVNAAPWTRRRPNSVSTLAEHDRECGRVLRGCIVWVMWFYCMDGVGGVHGRRCG